jgi:hypothetical protein
VGVRLFAFLGFSLPARLRLTGRPRFTSFDFLNQSTLTHGSLVCA